MPLGTQIKRNGQLLKIRWSGFHVAAMVVVTQLDRSAVSCEAACPGYKDGEQVLLTRHDVFEYVSYGAIGASPLYTGSYTLEHGPYVFIDETNGEVFEFKVGDVLSAYRSF